MRSLGPVAALWLLAACAPRAATTPSPTMDPGRIHDPPAVAPSPPPPPPSPVLPPSEAYRRGLMPLASTNAWAFRQANPTYDGRGVLIAIMDSGIDPALGGLTQTSTGAPKILDLRDFSAEGRVVLAPLTQRGDTAIVGTTRLAGMSRVAATGATPFFAGVLVERPLGEMPASDLNGDGDNRDSLVVVVAKGTAGWLLFADTDGDGSLANERPVQDYLVARETFGWSTRGAPTPMTVAANFSGEGAVPTLDLFFDNSGHGTHVAGIAAGAGLYGVSGFDGVAPGAQVLGLKISNNAQGGISTTGSMVRAAGYAIRFARARQLPLVINLSFGVGNEREGSARIDAMVDSILAANPDVIFTTSAGNDGPGLSTMGFPGSADRVVSVGATIPPAFFGGTAVAGDVVAFFSSRGGELAKPDILAPGIAYSSVPRWETGSEDKSGTSMAAPHVAGAMALLLSGLKQEGRSWTAAQVKQAVAATGRPVAGSLRADQGAGLLDLTAADRVLRRLPAIAALRVRSAGVAGGGVFRLMTPGRAADTTVRVEIAGALGGPVRLASNVGWLSVPPSVQLTPPLTSFDITIRGSGLAASGVAGGTISAWATDTTIGPLFRVPVTVVRPHEVSDTGTSLRALLTAAGIQRMFVAADSGRPFRVTAGSAARGEETLVFLHEPGGQPYRVEPAQRGGFGEEAAVFDVDGRDVASGYYEIIAVAPPTAGATVEIRVDRSPVTLDAARGINDSLFGTVTNRSGARVAGTAMLGLVGAERRMAFSQRGSAERRIPLRVPGWARRVVVELTVPRDMWPQFTDLGLSLVDGTGQIVANGPLNYYLGRVTADLDSSWAGRDLNVLVAPALADPAAQPLWDGNLSIRFLAESPVLAETPGSAEFDLEAGASTRIRFSLGAVPWAVGDGFFPLASFVVDLNGDLWAREVGLPERTPPIMR